MLPASLAEAGFKKIKMPTLIKSASVKVMLSYDYSHFEASMSLENDNGLSLRDIDEARKNCQRLADKAVGQYKTAKQDAIKQTGTSYERQQLEKEVRDIKVNKKEEDWTLLERAKVKALADYDHQAMYDYDDDGEYHPF
jgi:hypothetical protein